MWLLSSKKNNFSNRAFILFESLIIRGIIVRLFFPAKKSIPQTRAVIFLKIDYTDKTRVILEFKLK